jgi:hypothetical protein
MITQDTSKRGKTNEIGLQRLKNDSLRFNGSSRSVSEGMYGLVTLASHMDQPAQPLFRGGQSFHGTSKLEMT